MNTFSNVVGKNILIINNQAGGGHRNAVEAISQQVQENHGNICIKDIFTDILGRKISKFLYNFWNDAMKCENLKKLNFPLKIQPISEFFLGFPEFFDVLYWLLAHKIDFVINPQPAGLHALVKAVKCANLINKWLHRQEKILVYNVLTELPTKLTTDFFATYKRLSHLDRKVCRLVTTKPIPSLIKNSEQEFWKKHTGFNLSQIIYDEFPIRKPFLKAMKTDVKEIKSLKIEIKTPLAQQLLKTLPIMTTKEFEQGLNSIEIDEEDKVSSIMLGSQAGIDSTLRYVSNIMDGHKKELDLKHFVFVFCGDTAIKEGLYDKVHSLVKIKQEFSSFPNLFIIPLENQTADVIAPIFKRSQLTITRAGGLTAMELDRVASGQIYIHSNTEDPSKSMPQWEAGNYLHLKAHKGAKIITSHNSQSILSNSDPKIQSLLKIKSIKKVKFMTDITQDLANKNVLILNHLGGGGHQTAIEGMAPKIQKNGTTVIKDVYNDILGKKIASIGYNYWNEAMKNEDTETLKNCLKTQNLTDYFLNFPAFFHFLYWIMAKKIDFVKIDAVVNPQPAGIQALAKAVRCANLINKFILRNKKEIMIYNVMTELPTDKSLNFFKSYKKLSHGDKKVCKLLTTKPLLTDLPLGKKNKKKEEAFWKKHTGFNMSQIIYDDNFPLRQPIINYSKKDPKSIKTVKITVNTPEAKELLKSASILSYNNINLGENSIDISEKDVVSSIMLGSQAGISSTMKYVNDIIDIARTTKESKKVFVFCGNSASKEGLYEKVCNLVKLRKEQNEFPDNLTIIPLENQTSEQIAPIFRKSHETITRSGGMTSMELLKLSSGQIYIHSNHEEPTDGMPIWEAGNFEYLQYHKNARIITTKNSKDLLCTIK